VGGLLAADGVDPVEIVAAVLVLLNVALVARRSVWNYPVGIAAVLLYGWVFAVARLYSDAGLQGFFLVLNVYGWRNWAANRQAAGTVQVLRLSNPARLAWVAGIAGVAWGWGGLMHRYTDASYPWWDAGIAAASVAAQVMMARRQWENWLLWIAVDVASVGLYANKGLWPTTLVYSLLTGLAVWGLGDWLRARRRQRDKRRGSA
jgi:nicotinamide mononucleotide transporter